jgi:pilus assembly protein CpaB
MRGNIIVMLVLAMISGAIAVFLANVWLNNQNQQVPVAAPTPAVETSTIVVAATNLGYGVPLQRETLREISWPKGSVPDGAFAKISDVLTEGRRVVLSPISPNEPVLKWKISGPGARASLSAVVTEGMRAVAVRVNDVVGVGGFVLPGDRIDLLYTRNQHKEQAASTDILIQNVRVLAIDQDADQKKDQPAVVKVVTLEVNSLDAQKIALAQTTGSLSLTLRAAGSLDRAAAQRVVENELVSSPSIYQAEIDAQKAARLALEAKLRGLEQLAANPPKAAEVVEPAAFFTEADLNTTVGVTRGTKREIYEVPLEKRATQ